MDKLKITYENKITVPMVQGNLQLIMKLFEKKECSKWQVLFMRQNTRFLRGWHLDKKPKSNNVVVFFSSPVYLHFGIDRIRPTFTGPLY